MEASKTKQELPSLSEALLPLQLSRNKSQNVFTTILGKNS